MSQESITPKKLTLFRNTLLESRRKSSSGSSTQDADGLAYRIRSHHHSLLPTQVNALPAQLIPAKSERRLSLNLFSAREFSNETFVSLNQGGKFILRKRGTRSSRKSDLPLIIDKVIFQFLNLHSDWSEIMYNLSVSIEISKKIIIIK